MSSGRAWGATRACSTRRPRCGREGEAEGRRGGRARARRALTPSSVPQILAAARSSNTAVLLDADGLSLAAADPGRVRGWRAAVLTPNPVEFGRLAAALGVDARAPDALQAVADALDGPCVVRKGSEDGVAVRGAPPASVSVAGAPRRAGGQGDLVSGATATFLAWAVAAAREGGGAPDTAAAAFAGCALVRHAAAASFRTHGRASLAGDVLAEIGPAFGREWEREDEGGRGA